ncbi:putative membrane protein [Halarchaeum solikamskense]|uniref:DUF202 domain-containing protein n=1 Tax=Halarchaeum nitratireducens TaxID=489913 RepID=UPI001B3A8305|nr:DUF202 domain-containing protein [Halarchaeum solikamskense]MBP2250015.1 putative membrane protein [Halarchaeum solikamskense]
MSDDPSGRDADVERTQLAAERTRLARERTTLAHIRTGFASFLFGTAVLGLFDRPTAVPLGGAFVLVGVAFLATGWVSYARSNRRTRALLDDLERPFRRRRRR